MAKVRMVTRTVKVTEVTALTVNAESREMFEVSGTVAGIYENNEDLISAFKAIVKPGHIPVHIIKSEVQRIKYGMPESKFIANSEVLDGYLDDNSDEIENQISIEENEEVK